MTAESSPITLELLAPARDAEIGIAAIMHGADAVYIGGPSFGARASAGNSVADIAKLVQVAQRFHARIFVTLNTILRDDELEPAVALIHDLYQVGVDALIVQDMGLLECDLPPIQLHASTQTDIRTPEKARFLQDVGFSQIVLARELTREQIADIHAALRAPGANGAAPAHVADLEFFIHGALCVAYSGQCYISHAHTGRSANRGDCSQACRLPYEVRDSQGRILAHDKHVLSMKDNNQSDNLAALIAAGVQSFKIEGRYKDLAYVKNITAHYRRLLDDFLAAHSPRYRARAHGQCQFHFTPDPLQNFNREFTDYFVQGRQIDIAALNSPKNPGQSLGWVSRITNTQIEITCHDPRTQLHNGDGLCYYDSQQQLQGMQLNTVQCLDAATSRWLVEPQTPVAQLPDMRKGLLLNRNRDAAWLKQLNKPSATRKMAISMDLYWLEAAQQLQLTLRDTYGSQAQAALSMHSHALQTMHHTPTRADYVHTLVESLGRLGDSDFYLAEDGLAVHFDHAWFFPRAQLNTLRRTAVAALVQARQQGLQRLSRAPAVQPPARYPEVHLSYLANVYNQRAFAFYQRHGVQVVEAAYESQEALGDVSLMITKHCVRFTLSLCPKQAKGVIGVQGTVRAEPLQLINGKEKLTLRFDCKACEMHVVGAMKKSVLRTTAQSAMVQPIYIYRTR